MKQAVAVSHDDQEGTSVQSAQTEDILGTAPIFVLAIDKSMHLTYVSKAAGLSLDGDRGHNLSDVADVVTLAAFASVWRRLLPESPPEMMLAKFIGRNGLPLRIAGLVERIEVDGRALLRFSACYHPRSDKWLEKLILSEEVLSGFVQNSSEAMWCIEYSEPVDITLSEREIVRQVFENDCHWLLCNQALSRLYGLPAGLDVNSQPVSLYFPRIPENEEFIIRIIRSDFAIDKVPSTDFRHDGSALYMENKVRCSILNDQLFRIWGTLRDVTDIRQTHNRLKHEADSVRDILAALPDAILVIDRERRLTAVNPSFETLFGWSSATFLGRDVQSIVDLERPLPGGRRWHGASQQRWHTTVWTKSGTPRHCEAQIAPIGDGDSEHFVLSLRPIVEADCICEEVI